MTAPKHSPTPWHVGGNGLIVYDATGRPVANATVYLTPCPEADARLNAELICRAVNAFAEQPAAKPSGGAS